MCVPQIKIRERLNVLDDPQSPRLARICSECQWSASKRRRYLRAECNSASSERREDMSLIADLADHATQKRSKSLL
jgi:hypothetical protein